jgi:hypothetical protein
MDNGVFMSKSYRIRCRGAGIERHKSDLDLVWQHCQHTPLNACWGTGIHP